MAKPLRPFKTTVKAINSTTIQLDWVNQADVTINHLHVYLSEGASDKFVLNKDNIAPSTISTQITNLKPATRYSVYVVSVNSSGEESETWTAKSCTTPADGSDVYLEGARQIVNTTVVETTEPIEKCDVLVIGAGFGGISAAYGAALEGKKVILLEKTMHIGGVAIHAGVNTYMYTNAYAKPYQDWYDRYMQTSHYPTNTLGLGWGKKGLIKTSAESGGNYEPAFAEAIWLDMLRDVGVSVRLGEMGTQAIVERKSGARDKIVGVIAENEFSGRYAIIAKVVIDCTYNLSIAYDAGAEYMFGRESKTQKVVRKKGYADTFEAHSESCIVGGVDQVPDIPDDLIQGYSSHLYLQKVTSAITAKKPSSAFNYTQNSDLPQGSWGNYQHQMPDQLMQNVLRVVGDPRDASSMQYAIHKHMKQAMGYQYFFNTIDPNDKTWLLTHVPSLLGIRESRRIVGDYVMIASDIYPGVKPSDSIARGNYVIDIHGTTGDGSAGTLVYPSNHIALTLPDGAYYGIPYRSLYSRNIDNLLCPSARNLSASHLAIASTRIQIQVMATGFAGGLAAAQAIDNSQFVRDIDVATLQSRLTYYGQPYN